MLTKLIRLRLRQTSRTPRRLHTLEANSPAPSPSAFPLYRPEREEQALNHHYGRTRYDTGESAKIDKDWEKAKRSLKIKLTNDFINDLPEYTEEDLKKFYRDVILSEHELTDGSSRDGVKNLISEPRYEISRRSIVDSNSKGVIVAGGKEIHDSGVIRDDIVLRGAYDRLREGKEEGAESSRARSDAEKIVSFLWNKIEMHGLEIDSSGSINVQLGLLSKMEWTVLFKELCKEGSSVSLKQLFALLPRNGVSIDPKEIRLALGRVTPRIGRRHMKEVALTLVQYLENQVEELSSADHNAIISLNLALDHTARSSINYLKSYETLTTPLPQSSYDLILGHLSSKHSTANQRATAWDLYSHMRLVAHPDPSPEVYRTMILSCANSSDPKPEQARDLWIEITQSSQHKDQLNEPDHTAIIRALCSTKSTYLEGFEIFRQLLSKHSHFSYMPFEDSLANQDGWSRYLPSKETWRALLEGCKRAGDVKRARWVLEECIRMGDVLVKNGVKGKDEVCVDEDMIAGVFMTYAAWRPERKRLEVILKKDESELKEESQDSIASIDQTGGSALSGITRNELLGEARALLREIQDQTSDSSFSGVNITARLINSYLSVQYAHSVNIDSCRTAWKDAWKGSNPVKSNGWSYLLALERLAVGQRHLQSGMNKDHEREAALSWAEELWTDYMSFTAQHSSSSASITTSDTIQAENEYAIGLGSRQIERCWKSMIRIQTLCGRPSTALSYLDQFYTLHPPNAIKAGYSPSTEYGLSIRFSDPTILPESNVPPHLTFQDLDVLHSRLVRDGDVQNVGKIKWISRAYEGALVKRRAWRLKGVGRGREERKLEAFKRRGAGAERISVA